MLVADQTCHPMWTRWNRFRQVVRARYHRKFARDIGALVHFLPQNGVYLDIGANHGRFALELSRTHHGNCSVHTFEPLMYNLQVLERALKGRTNVTIHRHGLSDQTSKLDLLVPLRPDGTFRHGNSFVSDESGINQCREEDASYFHQGVHLRPLDEIAAEQNLTRVDFIKIDVEGHEEAVLSGGAGTLTKYRPTIMIEMVIEWATRNRRILKKLAAQGYQFFDLDLQGEAVWTDDVDVIAQSLESADKHHDLLIWHPDGPVGGATPPEFAIPLENTRFGA